MIFHILKRNKAKRLQITENELINLLVRDIMFVLFIVLVWAYTRRLCCSKCVTVRKCNARAHL